MHYLQILGKKGNFYYVTCMEKQYTARERFLLFFFFAVVIILILSTNCQMPQVHTRKADITRICEVRSYHKIFVNSAI